MSPLRTMSEVGLFAALVVADAYGLLPITQTLYLLPLAWILLKLRRETWAGVGFEKPPSLPAALGIGVVAGVLLEAFAVSVTTPMIRAWSGVQPDYSAFAEIEGNPTMLLVCLALSWSLAAFGEERCFRGFLMGWGHTEQGVSGWVQEGLSGLWLGVLYLLVGRNLIAPIVAHGVSNTVAFVLIYFGRYPGVH